MVSTRSSGKDSFGASGMTATGSTTTTTTTDFSAFLAPTTAVVPAPAKNGNRWNVVSPAGNSNVAATTTTPATIKKTTGCATLATAPALKQAAIATTTSANAHNDGSSGKNATQSFGAKTAASFPELKDENIPVHTLILGTHPSVKSLEEQEYYGHPLNAYWWIVGDCLGFRRDKGISASSGKPFGFVSDIRYDNTHIIPYKKQLETLCSKGFAMWDIIQSCHRPGSLDQDIVDDEPNDIPGFCKEHPTLRRIVLTGGKGGCGFFKRHFKKLLDSGLVVPCPNDRATQNEFKKWVVPESVAKNKIVVISALAVSPAAARYTYKEKRDFWEEHIFKPGLEDFQLEVKTAGKPKPPPPVPVAAPVPIPAGSVARTDAPQNDENIIVKLDGDFGSFIVPSGSYTVEFYTDFFCLRGNGLGHKIKFQDVIQSFLLPYPDEEHMAFVVFLRRPIQEGKKQHQQLVFKTSKKPDEIKLNLDSETIRKNYDNNLQPILRGLRMNLIAKMFKVLVKTKIYIPGKFGKGNEQDLPCIRCEMGGNEGLLYPLEKQFVFIHEPTILIRFERVKSIVCRWRDVQTKKFDIEVWTQNKTSRARLEYTFSDVSNKSVTALIAFLARKIADVVVKGPLIRPPPPSDDESSDEDLFGDSSSSDDEDYTNNGKASTTPSTPKRPWSNSKKPSPPGLLPTKPSPTTNGGEIATQSFGAKTAASFPELKDENIPVHTLILGTHPSVKSLEEQEYYGHPLNAYWWIVGDCLGFRRDKGISASSGKPFGFVSDIRYDNTHIIPYKKQLETLCSKGFAMWDIIQSCHRPGSLDQDIVDDEPNDIPGFCKEHPTLRRIVLTGGKGGCGFFKRHFKKLLDSGLVVPCPNDRATQNEFKKWVVPESVAKNKIVVISALAVSPAAARYTYKEKRDFWEEHIFKPGLEDFMATHKPTTGKRKRISCGDDDDDSDDSLGGTDAGTSTPTRPPKRSKSSFLFFCDDFRALVMAENSGKPFSVRAKLLAEKYKTLSDAEREKYIALAVKDKERYEKELAAYNAGK